ncbi:MAG: 4-(cytidine 5'-diphospho)-2-C-methyl-D-erythritol kinase [Verrucomicrobiota bacterium]
MLLLDAPAKVNLSLRILGKREDGFHELETLMVPVSLTDTLTLETDSTGGLDFSCDAVDLPVDETNLVVKAVRSLEAHCGRAFDLKVHLAKRIPSGAGLGGGSSDAALVLEGVNRVLDLGLNQETLVSLASGLGSDIPFFLYRRPCQCKGRGEIIEPVSVDGPPTSIMLLKPDYPIATPWAYQAWAGSDGAIDFDQSPQDLGWCSLVNDLERPVFKKFPFLGQLKSWLRDQDETQGALLSGSGSTVFAVLKDPGAGPALTAKVAKRYEGCLWTFVGELTGLNG